jgi:protein HIRA/HIR1
MALRNVNQQVALMSSVSIAPILQPALYAADTPSNSVSVTYAAVRANGLPLLATSAGQGFSWHEGMKAWVKIVDAWFASSSFFGVDPVFGGKLNQQAVSPLGQCKGVLAQLQAASTMGRLDKDAAFAQELLNVEATVQNSVTLSHLEVNNSAMIENKKDAIAFRTKY